MVTHVVIPDCHAGPNIPNDRFEWAGRLCLDRKPDVIVNLGDFADMPSLCSYDKGKKTYEGRRYADDIASVKDALARFNGPIDEYNSQRRRNGKLQYRPRRVMLLGNHEDRISRAIEASPTQLEGVISLTDLGFEEAGWEVIPYLRPIKIDGIYYSHYMVSGVKGEAISGFNVGASILSKHMASCTVGHIHLFDHAVRSTPDGRRFHGLSAGCFFDHHMQYADSSSHLWWSGLVIKNDVVDGDYDLEMISLKRLRSMYGN